LTAGTSRLNLNEEVRKYWEREPCGTGEPISGGVAPLTREWFERIEEHRYREEPFIHSVAQFTLHRGKKMLEVGVGAGTDHLQWARAGCDCHGVDLTDTAIETTRAHLALYGFASELRRLDAERLPFPDASFDLVYSWGVIHHSHKPDRVVDEIGRVLKPGGQFIGMLYGRRSPLVLRAWVRHALLRGQPWRSFSDVVRQHVESVGTKAYTVSEVGALFSRFRQLEVRPLITPYDTARYPRWLARLFPDRWGWFITVKALR
jgi:ubiquinone/menaquinone biosynthesis C-methylase UbiE